MNYKKYYEKQYEKERVRMFEDDVSKKRQWPDVVTTCSNHHSCFSTCAYLIMALLSAIGYKTIGLLFFAGLFTFAHVWIDYKNKKIVSLKYYDK